MKTVERPFAVTILAILIMIKALMACGATARVLPIICQEGRKRIQQLSTTCRRTNIQKRKKEGYGGGGGWLSSSKRSLIPPILGARKL